MTETVGGEGISGISVGRRTGRSKVHVKAWHHGYATNENNTAILQIFRDGSLIGQKSDAGFGNYALNFEANYDIEPAAASSFSISYENSGAAVDSVGISATIESV